MKTEKFLESCKEELLLKNKMLNQVLQTDCDISVPGMVKHDGLNHHMRIEYSTAQRQG